VAYRPRQASLMPHFITKTESYASDDGASRGAIDIRYFQYQKSLVLNIRRLQCPLSLKTDVIESNRNYFLESTALLHTATASRDQVPACIISSCWAISSGASQARLFRLTSTSCSIGFSNTTQSTTLGKHQQVQLHCLRDSWRIGLALREHTVQIGLTFDWYRVLLISWPAELKIAVYVEMLMFVLAMQYAAEDETKVLLTQMYKNDFWLLQISFLLHFCYYRNYRILTPLCIITDSLVMEFWSKSSCNNVVTYSIDICIVHEYMSVSFAA